MIESTTGIVPRILAHLFGERASRLTERATRAHWLSYLLVLSQSIVVVLVLGHAELPLLLGGSWAIRAMASMGVFVLVALSSPPRCALYCQAVWHKGACRSHGTDGEVRVCPNGMRERRRLRRCTNQKWGVALSTDGV